MIRFLSRVNKVIDIKPSIRERYGRDGREGGGMGREGGGMG
jgi:hypothetical protein